MTEFNNISDEEFNAKISKARDQLHDQFLVPLQNGLVIDDKLSNLDALIICQAALGECLRLMVLLTADGNYNKQRIAVEVIQEILLAPITNGEARYCAYAQAKGAKYLEEHNNE